MVLADEPLDGVRLPHDQVRLGDDEWPVEPPGADHERDGALGAGCVVLGAEGRECVLLLGGGRWSVDWELSELLELLELPWSRPPPRPRSAHPEVQSAIATMRLVIKKSERFMAIPSSCMLLLAIVLCMIVFVNTLGADATYIL